MPVETSSRTGSLLREWRDRRRMSQLDLALEAGISARHLSFVETGRSQPSREMILRLSDQLDVPLRARNGILLAAGYAPEFAQLDLEQPEMAPIRDAIDLVLAGHDPYPAVVVDGAWEMIAANRSISLLLEGVSPDLLEPPVNVLRLSLHPAGVAPRIVNLAQWRSHLLDRLRRQIGLTGDAALRSLLAELEEYGAETAPDERAGEEIAVPLRVRTAAGELAFISTVATFGTAVEITASELSIESFFPADRSTADAMAAYVDSLPVT